MFCTVIRSPQSPRALCKAVINCWSALTSSKTPDTGSVRLAIAATLFARSIALAPPSASTPSPGWA